MLYGALGMAALLLGTMPALVAVGWGGVLLRRRWQGMARWIAAPLLIFTALLMLALASQEISDDQAPASSGKITMSR